MILGLDTATPATVVALLDPATGAAREGRHLPSPGQRPGHMTELMALVIGQMRSLEVDWPQVERIAVGVGPGTFTGLRIGVATARAIAATRGIPLVGLSTLHSLALVARTDAAPGDDAVLGVIDARRGEVFAAGWSLDAVQDPAAAPLLPPQVVPVAALAGVLRDSDRRWLAAGDGSIAFRQALERSGARVRREDSERNRVSAVEHCRLALGLAPEPLQGVRPEYLRAPDAEISLRASRQS